MGIEDAKELLDLLDDGIAYAEAHMVFLPDERAEGVLEDLVEGRRLLVEVFLGHFQVREAVKDEEPGVVLPVDAAVEIEVVVAQDQVIGMEERVGDLVVGVGGIVEPDAFPFKGGEVDARHDPEPVERVVLDEVLYDDITGGIVDDEGGVDGRELDEELALDLRRELGAAPSLDAFYFYSEILFEVLADVLPDGLISKGAFVLIL